MRGQVRIAALTLQAKREENEGTAKLSQNHLGIREINCSISESLGNKTIAVLEAGAAPQYIAQAEQYGYIYFTFNKIHEELHLGVVDLARPGVGRGRDGRGGVASNIASDAAEGLDLRASVGRHLDGAGPVLGHGRGDVVEEHGGGADILSNGE